MASLVRQYSTTKVRRESAADFSSRLQLNVPEITIITHRPSFVDINLEVTRQASRASNINFNRRITHIPQRANEAESTSMGGNGDDNEDGERTKSVTINADDDVADNVMFESGELNVHLDKLTWTNAHGKLSALVRKRISFSHPQRNPDLTVFPTPTLLQVFITLEIEESSQFAKYLGIFLKLVIILAIFGYVLSTLPVLRVFPTECDYPDCDDDPELCPGIAMSVFTLPYPHLPVNDNHNPSSSPSSSSSSSSLSQHHYHITIITTPSPSPHHPISRIHDLSRHIIPRV